MRLIILILFRKWIVYYYDIDFIPRAEYWYNLMFYLLGLLLLQREIKNSTRYTRIYQCLLYRLIRNKIKEKNFIYVLNIDGAFLFNSTFYKVPMFTEIINERMLSAWVVVVILVFYHLLL